MAHGKRVTVNRKWVLSFVFWVGIGCRAGAQEAVPGAQLVEQWLESQGDVTSVEAVFRQERKLRTLRRVLATEGRFWFVAPDKFRWEGGAPAKMVAWQGGDGKVTVAEPRKKRARIYDPADPEHAEMVHRLGLMKPGFGGGADAFKEMFEIRKVTRAEGSDVWEADLRFKDSKMAVAVMKVVMRVNGKSGDPVEFRLEFRDGTKIGWLFGEVIRGREIEEGVFSYELEGYDVSR